VLAKAKRKFKDEEKTTKKKKVNKFNQNLSFVFVVDEI
jgi:hypothetical protein